MKRPPLLLLLLFPATYLAAGFLFPIPYALPALIWGYRGDALWGQFFLGHALLALAVKDHKRFESVSRFVAMILVLYAGLWMLIGLLSLLFIAMESMVSGHVLSKDSSGGAGTLAVVSGVLVGAGILQYFLTPGDPWSDPKF